MHGNDPNRVVFYSKEDLAGGYYLQKGETILRAVTKSNYFDINDILELYNLKKYINNNLYLKTWTQVDINNFKLKASEYDQAIGRFMSNINDSNFLDIYDKTFDDYIQSFWELVNNQSIYTRFSKNIISNILLKEPSLIYEILTHKDLVNYFCTELKEFLMTFSKSAEILLSIYEVREDSLNNHMFLPKNLTIQEKEKIISNYLDSSERNLNYLRIIQNARNGNEFVLSDKTRLKAKRLYKSETEKILSETSTKFGVSISFPKNMTKPKKGYIDENMITHYTYSLDYIKKNRDYYTLFKNFKTLFEYVDEQNRINLLSKKRHFTIFERFMGVHSHNEYSIGYIFSLNEMSSQGQIYGYSQILSTLNISLECVLKFTFSSVFQEKYGFPDNAYFGIPSSTNSYLEKVRILAPEFESILKQFKLLVENNYIDFELLQISSSPSAIKDIPSLNQNKYIYFNTDNKEMGICSNLFFSDQTLLSYVEPFKDKQYQNLFDLLMKEQVCYNNYEEHQKAQVDYLINKGFLSITDDGFIRIPNLERVLILKDLHDNEVASVYHYPSSFQKEATKMAAENIIYFESSLFSRPEQSYFNYFLNKSEFTNGLDLRNSYSHGTQANPEEIQKHEYAYFTYLRLLFLVMLKIEDDLIISQIPKILQSDQATNLFINSSSPLP